MSRPLVSIVTPCYNGEKYLERFLKSVLNQTYFNLELVLVNDGSTDRTEQIVKKYRGIFEKRKISFIYLYQKNAGQAAALNKGLKLFSGEYLVWIDSDDEIMSDFIEKKVEFLERNSEYVYCYGKAIEVREEEPERITHIYEKRKRNDRYGFFEDIIFCKDVFFSGYMVKTKALDMVIRNREIYSGFGGQNAQLLLPLSWYYGEPGYVEDSIYKYYVHCDSHSHSQNTSEKIIRQLYNYEKILVATIESMEDNAAKKYIEIIKKYYVKLRFGNSIDTQNAQIIKKHYQELKQMNLNNLHDFLLAFKYTNKFIRMCFRIKG